MADRVIRAASHASRSAVRRHRPRRPHVPDSHLDRRSWRRRLPSKRCFNVVSKKPQLGRPCGVIDFDDELRAIELHRLHMVRHGLARPPRPSARRPRPAGRRSGPTSAGRATSLRNDANHRMSRLSPNGTGRGSTTSPCQLRSRKIASGCAASGSTPAVVRTTCPGGR